MHPRWKTNSKKNKQTRKTRFETKDTQKSLLLLFHSPFPSPGLESHAQCKQIRNSFISSFPKIASTEIITQLKKIEMALYVSSKVSKYVVIVNGFSLRLLRDEIALRHETTLHYFIYFGFVLYFSLVTRTSPLAFEM